jgi:phospholipid-binding lipoprotein MlaA
MSQFFRGNRVRRKIFFFFYLWIGLGLIFLMPIESKAEPSDGMDIEEFNSGFVDRSKSDWMARSDERMEFKEEAGPSFPEEEVLEERIWDPLEPLNRIFFHVNDRLYFWVLKPVATGYQKVFSKEVRNGVSNFFSNIATPIRLVNCVLQANLKGAATETLRFLINTPFGLFGFLDPAQKEFGLEKREEDLGQTFGVWGFGPAFYLEWPIIGSSNLRDTLGYIGDLFLDPITYLPSTPIRIGLKTYEKVNETSLRLGEYEDFKKVVLDPYIAKREAYHQNRKYKIKERK